MKLIRMRITTDEKVWDRCLILNYIPSQDDLEFYYSVLLGFNDAKITLTHEAIPDDFNSSLIPNYNEAPTDFPSCDLETDPDEEERRTKYTQFLNQLCEMERTRTALKTLKKPANVGRKYTTALTEDPLHLIGYAKQSNGTERRIWVEEILQELNSDSDDHSIIEVSPSIPPLGWILTPSAASARHTIGSRICMNAEIGSRWEKLLGTDVFPDLIVSRRLSSRGWSFQNPVSETLILNIINWFLSSQDTTLTDGLSPFIIGCDREIATFLSAFKNIRISNRLLQSVDDSHPQARMIHLLQSMEAQWLESADSNKDVQAISGPVFHKFLNYLFRAAEIQRDIFICDEHVSQAVDHWVKAGLGFKHGVDPILPKWKELWDVVMRGKPSAIKVNNFLASMDAWDPVASLSFTGIERAAIAQEWIRIYMDTQLIKDDDGKVKSVILYDQMKKWCLRFLPEHLFASQFATVNIGPALTKKGIISRKLKDGRYICGYRFKNLHGSSDDHGDAAVATEEEVKAATVREANTVVFSEVKNEDGSHTNQTLRHTVLQGMDGSRIEHYFASSVTQEIYLGDV
jgi:hypothetical protein